MPHKVIIEEQINYIRAVLSGEWIPGQVEKDGINALSTISKTCKEKQIYKILLVFNISGRYPTIPAYNLSLSPEKYGWSRKYKTAVVYVHKKATQDYKFGETVAVNNGYNSKLFDNENDAIKWLFKSQLD
jgi:hypothetical protein